MLAKGNLSVALPANSLWKKVFRPDFMKYACGAGLLALGVIFRQEIIDVVALVRDRDGLVAYLEPLGVWGALLLAVVIMLQVVVAAIPGHLLYFAGGYIYGFWGGFAITYLATVLIGQCTFYLARVYGRALVAKLVPEKDLNKWEKIAEKQGIGFFVLTFIIPIFPADVMSYIAGLGKIKGKDFLVANIIGRLPTVILMVLVGSHGLELDLKVMLVAVLMTVVMLMVVKKLGKRVEEKYEKEGEAG